MHALRIAAALTFTASIAFAGSGTEEHCATKTKSCCKKAAKKASAKASAQVKANPAKPASAATATPAGTASMRVVIDKETGELRAPTAAEAAAMDAKAAKRGDLNESSEGLVEVVHPNGMRSVDLQGRFMSESVARIGPDGAIVTGCVHSEAEKKAFLEKTSKPKPQSAPTE